MHVVVCFAPIVDPKVPSDRLALREDGCGLRTQGVGGILGPFDEAALEIALKLRDVDPDTRATAIMLGDVEDEACLRYALALRVETGVRVDVGDEARWDQGAVCRALRQVIVTLAPPPDLVLVGREFGDRDDGVVPPLLAECLGWRFFGLCHRAVRHAGEIVFVRALAASEEHAAFTPPVVASVTNHPDNRLRLPLLKNVLAAKRRPVMVVSADAVTADRRVRAVAAEIVPAAPRGRRRCRMLVGSSEAQASELARFLAPWVRTA